MRYIAFLRGINVGGHKRMKMLDLRRMFELLKFNSVQTYIQSGNIIFESDCTNVLKMVNLIENKIIEIFGFSVSVVIRLDYELNNIIASNPFTHDPYIELDKLYLTLMQGTPDPNAMLLLGWEKQGNEKISIISREIYLYCPNGYGKTKLNNTLLEKKLNAILTTRNWKTIEKISSLYIEKEF